MGIGQEKSSPVSSASYCQWAFLAFEAGEIDVKWIF